jgi:hypothetical protein
MSYLANVVLVPTTISLVVEVVIKPIPSFITEYIGEGIKFRSKSVNVLVFLVAI